MAKELDLESKDIDKAVRQAAPKSADQPVPGPGMAVSPHGPTIPTPWRTDETADRAGPRTWLLLPAAVLVLSGLAAGCSSSTPAYCTDAANLKTSVSNLGNVDVAKNGLSSLQTALNSVKTDATSFATDAKSAYPSQTAALNTEVSGLQTAITSAKGQPPLTAATAVASSVSQVKSSASTLQSAVSGAC